MWIKSPSEIIPSKRRGMSSDLAAPLSLTGLGLVVGALSISLLAGPPGQPPLLPAPHPRQCEGSFPYHW